MKKRLLLILATIGLLVLAYVCFCKMHQPTKVFTTYQIETTLNWTDGPDVELNADSIKELNAEVTALLDQEAPGENLTYPVISIGKKSVQVMYISDKPGPSQFVQDILNVFIQKRAGELAAEQIDTGS
jgi:hypothetical protein